MIVLRGARPAPGCRNAMKGFEMTWDQTPWRNSKTPPLRHHPLSSILFLLPLELEADYQIPFSSSHGFDKTRRRCLLRPPRLLLASSSAPCIQFNTRGSAEAKNILSQ